MLRPGGKAIGIAGPPDPAFARQAGMNPVLRLAIAALSRKIRRQAKTLGVTYEFLFMRASGDQLRQITALVDSGAVRPVVGQVFDFDQTAEAVRSLGKGGTRGKAVISRRDKHSTPVEQGSW